MCGLALRLFEDDGRMIAFPLPSWLIRPAGIIPNPWRTKGHRGLIANVLLAKVSYRIVIRLDLVGSG
jgi:hypothetical protein